MSRLTSTNPRPGAQIMAIDGVRGEVAVTNHEVAGAIESSDEWIRQRTGIVTRRRAQAQTGVLDLAEQAARRALERAQLGPSQIGAVILASITHFDSTPAGAPQLATRLGLGPVPAYDISAACAGYCYAIGQADALVRAGLVEYVLVVGAEKLSDFIDPTDRTISFLLGDGAGAAVVGPSERPRIGPTVWGSDGAQAGAICQDRSWPEAVRSGVAPTLRQAGPAVFKWASFKLAPVAREAITVAGLQPDQIDIFAPHQANLRIIDQLAKAIKLPSTTLVARDIIETGNTSAASVPLALEALRREHGPLGGRLALQIGFGAGLAYAAQVVELPAT